MIDIKVITDLVNEPISVSEAKEWMSIDYPDFDNLIFTLIVAAREQSEKVSGQAYGVKTFEVTGNEKDHKVYPIGPFIEDVEWEDEDGVCKYRYKAGYEHVPDSLRIAIFQRVATGYAYRQNGIAEAVNKTVNQSSHSELKYSYLFI